MRSSIHITCDSFKILAKQEAHGPVRVAHLSDIATADMQMLCNIFPILSSQLMKRSPFKVTTDTWPLFFSQQ